jgi:uncharacterized membrane protein YhaH (DUF805 family)
MGEFFWFDGRVRRITFWANGVITLVVYLVLSLVLLGDNAGTFSGLLFFVAFMVLALRGLSISARRWHDLNKSGWWWLISLIPIVGGLYALGMQGFVPGDDGPNDYGDQPEEGQWF